MRLFVNRSLTDGGPNHGAGLFRTPPHLKVQVPLRRQQLESPASSFPLTGWARKELGYSIPVLPATPTAQLGQAHHRPYPGVNRAAPAAVLHRMGPSELFSRSSIPYCGAPSGQPGQLGLPACQRPTTGSPRLHFLSKIRTPSLTSCITSFCLSAGDDVMGCSAIPYDLSLVAPPHSSGPLLCQGWCAALSSSAPSLTVAGSLPCTGPQPNNATPWGREERPAGPNLGCHTHPLLMGNAAVLVSGFPGCSTMSAGLLGTELRLLMPESG
ncbi:hypothetical protein NDU88_006214 [Pleurodeles waltl]|uniref:Uncharacterized protein n=1 Tax=Pleurodeles waltl TaxID=8319 RepID=A0AAV7PHP5_PLEWA|nr:hypothetical protein NDU88_006214 [Pleurodeles waltl]